MNKFIKQSLEEGEEIIYNGRLHWTSITSYIMWTLLLVIATIGITVYGYLQEESGTIYYYLSGVCAVAALVVYIIGRIVRTRSEFVVTSTRFIQKDGIFNIKMTEIPLFKVETVNFTQTLGQRILGTGCIEMVGSGGTSHQIHCIESPMEVRKTIVSAISKSEQAQQKNEE